MASTGKKRLFLSSIYLGILFLVAGVAFHYLQRFEGTVFLLPGAAESLVFSPAGGSFRLGAAQRGVAPDLLLFDNPRSVEALRADQRYDGAILPFALRLDGVEVVKEHEARQVIHIDGPGEKRREEVAPGARVGLGGGFLEVESMGPWEGLVRDPRGQPMAAIEIPGGERGPLVFLESGHACILQPDLAVCFLWHGSEAEARQAFVPALEDAAGARWGVREGKSIQWFENFIPGTGLVLHDGTRVTMAEVSRSEGYITLRIQRSAGMEMKRVVANASSSDAHFLYEDPAATGRILYLHSWRENMALGRLLLRGEPAKEFEFAVGGGEGPVVLRQVMAQALAVPGGSIRAAHVRLGEQAIDLREGLAETLGDYRLRYQIEPVPPDARYRMAALDPKGAVLEERALEGDEALRVGAWVFALSPENPFAPRGVALTAERRPGGLGQSIGLALFVLGSFGLVFVRFAPR